MAERRQQPGTPVVQPAVDAVDADEMSALFSDLEVQRQAQALTKLGAALVYVGPLMYQAQQLHGTVGRLTNEFANLQRDVARLRAELESVTAELDARRASFASAEADAIKQAQQQAHDAFVARSGALDKDAQQQLDAKQAEVAQLTQVAQGLRQTRDNLLASIKAV